MTKFNNNNDPKVISNLSSNHAYGSNLNSSNKLYKPQNLERRDSSTFHETKIKYQNNMIPDYSKIKGKNVSMPKVEYTEEKVLPRPIEDKNKKLNIESKEKEMPTFTKSVTEPMVNPVQELFQNAKTSTEVIQEKKVEEIPKKKRKKSKFTLFIIIGIILEIIILGIIYLVKEMNSKEILECTSKNYNSYYGATITNTKKYYFKNNKITKLEDTVEYAFDNKELYESYKTDYATPPYSVIDGRIIVTNINDNDYIYEEKATYDYTKLRKKNESNDSHNIVIDSDKSYDSIYLIDYNITDIKIIYEEDYTCR